MGNDCSGCHTGSLGFGGSVEILGVPAGYAPDQIYNLSVKISDPGQDSAGFELSAEDAVGNHVGTLIVSDAVNTQLNSVEPTYIHHTGDGVDNALANWVAMGNSATYNIQWQAPSVDVGPVTFWAAGNAIDNSFGPSGDHVYVTSVTSGGAVPAVSAWGLLVFGLLLAAAGTLAAARKTAPVQA